MIQNLDWLISIIPVILSFGALIYGILGDNKFLIFLSIGLFLCWYISEFIKQLMPTEGIFLRPTNFPCLCRYYPDTCINFQEIGMPSTHASTITFFLTMIYLRNPYIDYKILLVFLLVFLVMRQRYLSKCHSISQILFGALLGVFLAFVYNFLLKQFKI